MTDFEAECKRLEAEFNVERNRLYKELGMDAMDVALNIGKELTGDPELEEIKRRTGGCGAEWKAAHIRKVLARVKQF